jgi:hypothetical protein
LAKNNGLGTSRSRAYQQNSAVSMIGKEADVSEIRASVSGF